jgi:hypothetical protein
MKRSFLALFISLLSITMAGYANPDSTFQIRGFHLDMRIQVMKMPALRAFVKTLSENGINTLLLEWEATYPFQQHRVISNQYAYTREEVKSFIAYCNQLKIDVIPLQQSFGHVEYILRHSRYAQLREDDRDYSQVNPTKEKECRELFSDLYKDLIATHTSKYIHIGGDETMLLGHSPASKRKADSLGMSRLYGDYIRMLCELVVSLGKTPIVWADIALKYPEALKDLPKETIFLDWNYGWALDRFGDHKKLQESGFEIWGAPAIRSGPDNYFIASWKTHFKNMETFIPQARALNYKGIIMTSWSTSGVYSPIFESYADPVDLMAIRRVYPQVGFNLLINAYFEALKTDKALDTRAFVRQYCQKRYGFNAAQSDAFLQAISTVPLELKDGKVLGADLTIDALRDSVTAAQKTLYSLSLSTKEAEFGHYLLMADIRAFYLACKWVEVSMNKPDYSPEKRPQLLKVLADLHPGKLDARFIELNRNTYYLSELKKENDVRNTSYNYLKAQLENKND